MLSRVIALAALAALAVCSPAAARPELVQRHNVRAHHTLSKPSAKRARARAGNPARRQQPAPTTPPARTTSAAPRVTPPSAPTAVPASPVVPAPPAGSPPLPSLIGVGNVRGCMHGADPTPTLHAYGANVLRVIVSPRWVQPSGKVVGSGYDGSAVPCVKAAHDAGYKVLLVMQWWNAFRLADVVSFYQQTLPMYAPYAWAIAIGNEQDINSGGDETAADYATRWKSLAPLARSMAPSARLVAGEISPWGIDWLRNAVHAGLPGASAIAAHCYSMHDAFLFPDIEQLAHSAGLPLWFDEGLDAAGAWGKDTGNVVPLSTMGGIKLAATWLA